MIFNTTHSCKCCDTEVNISPMLLQLIFSEAVSVFFSPSVFYVMSLTRANYLAIYCTVFGKLKLAFSSTHTQRTHTHYQDVKYLYRDVPLKIYQYQLLNPTTTDTSTRHHQILNSGLTTSIHQRWNRLKKNVPDQSVKPQGYNHHTVSRHHIPQLVAVKETDAI